MDIEGTDFQSFFTYGKLVQITVNGKVYNTLMILNPKNNFFLDFISEKRDISFVKRVFIPHMKNFQDKREENQIKIRMENPKKSFYIHYNTRNYYELISHFQDLIDHTKKLNYCVYSWFNKVYYMIVEMKLYRYKNYIFKDKDYRKSLRRLKTIQVKKDMLSSFLDDNEAIHNDIKHQKGFQAYSVYYTSQEEFYLLLRSKLFQILENKQTAMTMEEASNIFKCMAQNNELKFIYDIFLHENEDFNTKKSFKQMLIDKPISKDFIWQDQNLKFDKFLLFIEKFQIQKPSLEEINEFQIFFNQVRTTNLFEIKNNPIEEITYEEFTMYFFSNLNSIYPPQKAKNYQSNDYPLSNYYVSSSHNTYLVGHQLYGKSGIEGYQRALEFGYRCLEIDLWDGNLTTNEPRVTHGNTLTKNYSFRKIILFLQENWNKVNNNPLILSLEMNCNEYYRKRTGEILKEVFGDSLLILDDEKVLQTMTLEQLQGKILVKNNSVYPTSFKLKTDKKNPYLNDYLSQVTCIFKEPIKSQQFMNDQEIKMQSPWSIFSCSSYKMNGILEQKSPIYKVLDFTRNNLIRIFPDATKIGSSNYSPIPFWLAGCQLVSLNIQTTDEAILINKVMFKKNGGKRGGYLLKPKYMREKIEVVRKEYKVFSFDIITAQVFNRYIIKGKEEIIEISIRGHKLDVQNNKKLKFPLRCNLIHPKIDNDRNKFVFKLLFSEMAFFMFKIKVEGFTVIQGCLPANFIRSGIRALPLYNQVMYHDNYSFLLLKCSRKKEAVPQQFYLRHSSLHK